MRSTRLVVLLTLLALAAGVPAASAAPRPSTRTATVTLSPASGPAGSSTTVTGKGFAARSSGTLAVGGLSLAVTTDGGGAFSRSVVVQGVPGAVDVVAVVRDRTAATVFTLTAPSTRLAFGVSVPGGPSATAELDAVAATAGEQPTVVLSYTDVTRDLDRAGVDAVLARGATPLITLEPWVAGAGADQPAYSLEALARGDHDAYLTRFGAALRDVGAPVLLRFAHEMNGDWYPWAEAARGAAPGSYVAAWRHVHAVVTAAGATNADWVWSPNVPYWGSQDLSGLWPGADVVDVVALDGYNWGTSQTWSSWTAPADLFGPGLQALRALAPGKPVLVAEVASAEQGGDKAAWVRDLVSYLDAQPDVTGLVWFDHLKEADWRIASSTASADAFRAALAARS